MDPEYDYATIKYSAGVGIEEGKKDKEQLKNRKTIHTELPKDETFDLKIYNILGKIVYSGKDNQNLKELPTGVYFLQIETEEEKSARKIIVVK